MKRTHVIWVCFPDPDQNEDDYKKADDCINGMMWKPTKKSALRFIDRVYNHHGIYCFATINRRTKRSHGETVYTYAYYPRKSKAIKTGQEPSG